MKLLKAGKNTSKIEVLNINQRGIWLYILGKEFFLSYENFPWFKDCSIAEVCDVKMIREHYLRWNRLDVDLELESLSHPENYPLKFSN